MIIMQLEGLLLQHWLLYVCFWLGQQILLDSISLVHWWNGVACPLLLVSTDFALQDIQFFQTFISLWLTKENLPRQWLQGMVNPVYFERMFSFHFLFSYKLVTFYRKQLKKIFFYKQNWIIFKSNLVHNHLFCYLYFLYKSSKTRNKLKIRWQFYNYRWKHRMLS